MFLPNTRRITNDSFQRPEQTFTDTLQTEKGVMKKLKNYKRIQDISTVDRGTHVRYITWKNGGQRFCLGGWLRTVADQYIVLATKKLSWSVQRYHYDDDNNLLFTTLFFVKKGKLDEYEHVIKQQYLEIQELKKENKRLKRQLGIR